MMADGSSKQTCTDIAPEVNQNNSNAIITRKDVDNIHTKDRIAALHVHRLSQQLLCYLVNDTNTLIVKRTLDSKDGGERIVYVLWTYSWALSK